MKKLLLLLCLLIFTSSCGGVDIANDSSSSSEDNSVDIDNSTSGIYTCSYQCESDGETEDESDAYAESFEIEGGPEDCIKLVSELPQSCAIIDEEEEEVSELIVPEEVEEAPEPDDGFTF